MIPSVEDELPGLLHLLPTFPDPKVEVIMLSIIGVTIWWVLFLRFSARWNLFGSIPHFFYASTCMGGGVITPWRYLNIFIEKWRYLTCKLSGSVLVVQDLKDPLLSLIHGLGIKSSIFGFSSLRDSDLASIKLCTLILKPMHSSVECPIVPIWYSHLTFGWYSLNTKLWSSIHFWTLALNPLQSSIEFPIDLAWYPHLTLGSYSGENNNGRGWKDLGSTNEFWIKYI